MFWTVFGWYEFDFSMGEMGGHFSFTKMFFLKWCHGGCSHASAENNRFLDTNSMMLSWKVCPGGIPKRSPVNDQALAFMRTQFIYRSLFSTTGVSSIEITIHYSYAWKFRLSVGCRSAGFFSGWLPACWEMNWEANWGSKSPDRIAWHFDDYSGTPKSAVDPNARHFLYVTCRMCGLEVGR